MTTVRGRAYYSTDKVHPRTPLCEHVSVDIEPYEGYDGCEYVEYLYVHCDKCKVRHIVEILVN